MTAQKPGMPGPGDKFIQCGISLGCGGLTLLHAVCTLRSLGSHSESPFPACDAPHKTPLA